MTTVTRTAWVVLDAKWINDDRELDVIAVSLRGPDGEYAVTCAGPKGMNSVQFITALRAGTAALIRASGGDMSAVGASAPDDNDKFDTGDQRAN